MVVLNFFSISILVFHLAKLNSNSNNPPKFHYQLYFQFVDPIQTNNTIIIKLKFKEKAIINPKTIKKAITIPINKSICILNSSLIRIDNMTSPIIIKVKIIKTNDRNKSFSCLLGSLKDYSKLISLYILILKTN